MRVNDKMTAIADAIRVKTGGTNPLTLDQMAEAISSIESGGGFQIEGTTQREITIGANTISNGEDAAAYFKSVTAAVAVAILKTVPDANNQIVFYATNGSLLLTRYRGGSIINCGTTSAYDAVLAEGTTYLVIEWG